VVQIFHLSFHLFHCHVQFFFMIDLLSTVLPNRPMSVFQNLVMPVHGLIHDGQLWACPCALLGLMHGLRQLYASCWRRYKRSNPFFLFLVFLEFLVLRVASIVYWDFLDAHGGHYTATVYIRFHYFFAIHFNSRKTLFLLLNVESNKIHLMP
jgi:hypothetical protein